MRIALGIYPLNPKPLAIITASSGMISKTSNWIFSNIPIDPGKTASPSFGVFLFLKIMHNGLAVVCGLAFGEGALSFPPRDRKQHENRAVY